MPRCSEPRHSRRGVLGFVTASLLLHALLAGLALAVAPPQAKERRAEPVELRLVSPPPPTVEPPPPPPQAPPPPPPPPPVPTVVQRTALARKPAAPAPPPPPTAAPPPPPAGFSVDLDATVQGSAVAVVATPGGGNAYANPDDRRAPPGPGGPPSPPPPPPPAPRQAPLAAWAVEKLPDCPPLRPPYPATARDQGRESDVLLELQLDADGRVASARVKRSGGGEFDGPAVESALALRCAPALRGGEAVAVRIDYSVAYRLVD